MATTNKVTYRTAIAGVVFGTDPTDVTKTNSIKVSPAGELYTIASTAAGTDINVAASVSTNTAVVADVNAAVGAVAGLRLVGFACRESAVTAAASTFIIVHGATSAGSVLIPVELAANESSRDWFGSGGIACPNGLSIDWISGTSDIQLFYKVVV